MQLEPRRLHGVIFGLSIVAATSALGRAQDDRLPLNLTARAINMSNVAAGDRTSLVDIRVTRWSTDEEREALIRTFVEKGPTKLLDALQNVRPAVGFIRLPQTLAYDLRFARRVPSEDGGYRIILVTDRPISPAEAMRQPRTMDYPFTLVEIHMKKDNTGEGKLSVATKIVRNEKDKTVELENWATEPVRLTNVRVAR
jgi:hypothetical protein